MAHFNHGKSLAAAGNRTGATEQYQKASQVDPGRGESGAEILAINPTATPVVGKRGGAVTLGDAYTIRDGQSTFQVQVSAVERNAWPFVKKANKFNDAPPMGSDYIALKLKLTYLDGPQSESYKTTDGGYKLYADNRFWGAPGFGNVPAEPRFTGKDIFPGATVEGWLAGTYLPVELMDQAVLVYDEVYFAMK